MEQLQRPGQKGESKKSRGKEETAGSSVADGSGLEKESGGFVFGREVGRGGDELTKLRCGAFLWQKQYIE